jgi:WD repeat-containing protein 61
MADHKVYEPSGDAKEAHEDGVWAAAFCSGGRLMTGSVDEQLKLWTVGPDSLAGGAALSPGHSLGVISVSASATGDVCASSGLDGQINLWSMAEGGCEHTRSIDAGPGDSWKASLHPSGELVASGTQHGSIHLWRTLTGERAESLHTRGKRFVLAVAYSPDGAYLAAATIDGGVAIFDVARGSSLHELSASCMPVRALAFSPDSSLLGVGADDASFALYDVATGKPFHSFAAHAGWVLSAAFAPSGALIATSSTDCKIKLWDLATRKCVQELGSVHSDNVWQVAFEPDSGRLVSVGEDKRVQVYSPVGL